MTALAEVKDYGNGIKVQRHERPDSVTWRVYRGKFPIKNCASFDEADAYAKKEAEKPQK